MTNKERILVKIIDKWFDERGNLSKADYEMLKNFYWIMDNFKNGKGKK